MADEENLRFLRKVPEYVIFGVLVTMWIIFSREMVIINEVPVPVMFKDFQKLYQCGKFFLALAFLASYEAMIIYRECLFTRVCRWLGVMFLLLAICSFFICAQLSTNI